MPTIRCGCQWWTGQATLSTRSQASYEGCSQDGPRSCWMKAWPAPGACEDTSKMSVDCSSEDGLLVGLLTASGS